MKRIGRLLAAGCCVWGAAARAVDIGDRAPPLSGVKQWLNGEAVNPAQPDGKTIHVVEFWATWCAPCKTTIPHLNALQEQFRSNNVVFVGVTTEPETVVRPYMEKNPIRYRVGLDTDETTTATYMQEVEGIPTAFIVDTNGVIAWIGHPMDGMDKVLQGLMEGTHDPERIKRRQERQDQFMRAITENDFPAARKLADEMITDDAERIELYQMKAGLLMQQEDRAALQSLFAAMLDKFNNSAEDLNTLAWMIVNTPQAYRDLAVALRAARRAAELTPRPEGAVLDTLALVYYQLGWLREAVAQQEKALAAAADDDERKQFTEELRYYREALELHEKERPAPDAPPVESPARP